MRRNGVVGQTLERDRVHLDALGIERDRVTPGDQNTIARHAQRLAQLTQGLPQAGARLRFAPVAPQQADELLARAGAPGFQRQVRDQRPGLAALDLQCIARSQVCREPAQQINMKSRQRAALGCGSPRPSYGTVAK